MAMLAKLLAQPQAFQQSMIYELFDDANPIDAIDINGNSVQIRLSLGIYNVEDLNKQIA